MPNSKIDKIIQIIRENMVANAPGTQGGFGDSSPAEGPTAGTSGRKKKRKYMKGPGRKVWLDHLRSSNGRAS